MALEVIQTGYIARLWQDWAHQKVKRHNIIVFHRRGGKTVWAVNEIIDQSKRFDRMDPLTGKELRHPVFAFVATTIGQVEKIAWKYFKEYMRDIPGVKFNNQKLCVTYPHPRGLCTIYLFGAENFDAIRGIYLDGYVLDEYADMHPDVRDKVLLPTLSDRIGWEIIIGTPKGENAFKELYDFALQDPEGEWFHCLLKASETGIIADKELRMLKRTMSPEAYAQEYECDFNAAPSGKYFQKYIDEARRDDPPRVTDVPYDNSCLVSTYWDLGFQDSTGIWFVQEVGREIRVIRYIEEHGKGLEFYVDEINKYPYRYNEHVLPHDANAHELQTGKTRVEFLEEHGLENIRVLEKTKNIGEDIHAIRQILPKCWFDRPNCHDGLKALSGYERAWDAKKKVYSDKPKHNWASHGTDAFRTFAVDYQPGFGVALNTRYSDLPATADSDYNVLDDF